MPTITAAGFIPTPISTLRDELVALATSLSPGLTADLPGSLIEDLASTATGALAIQDQAAVDLGNSISPLTANPFILDQLGEVYGVRQGVGSNTSVSVVFSGTPGFVINSGFIIGDGTHQYVTQDPAIIETGGTSAPTFCLAVDAGTWAVPANTVTLKVTGVPSTITLTLTNPNPGTPSAAAQTPAQYQAQVIQAGQAVATGISTLVRTTLQKVAGVQARLVSFRQTGGGWQVLVGGGDPFEVANAIFQSMFNITDLQGPSAGGTLATAAIYDFPDVYTIKWVIPELQTVTMTVTWNTTATANFVDPNIVTSLVQPALADYVNSIFVGQPISTLLLEDAFTAAVAGVIPEAQLSKLQFIVSINGVEVDPPTGGTLITGNAEGYFFAQASGIAVVKG